ncbi:MAG: hypothetical protein PHI87_06205 [Candidatus Methanomethylophilus sp.]|nr:hypothetical protein [Methanomethylophilus sp.]MDD4222501.1 hypothetical protein [Methanomethylophilus sp.]
MSATKTKQAKAQSKRARMQSRDERGRFAAEGRKPLRKIREPKPAVGAKINKVRPAGSVVVEAKKEKVKVGGEEYFIPVDEKGYVPQYALAARFTNVGEGRGPNVEERSVAIDQSSEAKIVLKGRLTPEEVKEWWARPNLSDVKGVDDVDSTYFDLSALKTEGRKEAQGKIAVVGGTKKDQERIRKMLSESFTLKEQKAISKDGMTIEVTDLPRSYAGQYYGKSDGITYLIKVDPNYLDDDTLLHETVHHARLVDKGRGSNLVKSRSVYPDRVGVRGNDMALEEAATVAETHARQGDYRVSSNPHYYGLIMDDKGKDAFVMMKEDRELFAGTSETGSKGLRGKRALKAVEVNFDKSNISDLNLKGISSGKGGNYPDKYAKDRLKEINKNH